MRAVNLLPVDERRGTRLEGLRTPLLVAAGGVAAVTTGAVFLAISAAGTADERRAELAAVEATIARLPEAPDPAVSQGILLAERSDRVRALSAALETRVSFDRVLREISLVLPEDAWLTGLTATAPVDVAPAGTSEVPLPPVATTGPEGITIQGATYSHDSVARVLSRLSVVPSLENVRLTTSARVVPQPLEASGDNGRAAATTTGRPVVTFSISASFRSSEASP
jgi:Tfp pilus assembly protein PilN